MFGKKGYLPSPIYLTIFNKYTKIIKISKINILLMGHTSTLFKHISKRIQKNIKLILRMCLKTIIN